MSAKALRGSGAGKVLLRFAAYVRQDRGAEYYTDQSPGDGEGSTQTTKEGGADVDELGSWTQFSPRWRMIPHP